MYVNELDNIADTCQDKYQRTIERNQCIFF